VKEHPYNSIVRDSLATLLLTEANSRPLNTSGRRSDLPQVKTSTKWDRHARTEYVFLPSSSNFVLDQILGNVSFCSKRDFILRGQDPGDGTLFVFAVSKDTASNTRNANPSSL
jgi:hypothetical protein